MFDPEVWGTVGQWVAAAATLSAVLVALFKDEVLRRQRRPVEVPLLTLDVEVQPFTRAHLLAPGDYQLTIQIAAANATPVTKRLRMAFRGTWSPDERDMLSRGIGFSIADGR